MQPQSAQDYKNLLTEVIKKQIVILGPDITLSKARNVKGLTVLNDGTVTEVAGSPQEVIQALIDQFVQLSGLIVKKTMEPLLATQQPIPPAPLPTPQPIQPTVPNQPAPVVDQAPVPVVPQPTQPTAPNQPAPVVDQPPAPVSLPTQQLIPPTPLPEAVQTIVPPVPPAPPQLEVIPTSNSQPQPVTSAETPSAEQPQASIPNTPPTPATNPLAA